MAKSEVKEALAAGQSRRPLPRPVQTIGVILAALLALPFLLTLYYAVIPPPVSALMAWRTLQGRGLDYRYVPLERISPSLVAAVITAEDSQFCLHHGVDWGAVQDVVEDAFGSEEEPLRGASTIAMQTAKNLYLWEGRSVVRKALEVPLAVWIDATWTKRRQIEVYLNIAEWGPGIYGAEAAAERHFGRPAAKLTRQQSALLAAALPNPLKRHPARPSAGVRRKAAVIVQRMAAMDAFLACLDRRAF